MMIMAIVMAIIGFSAFITLVYGQSEPLTIYEDQFIVCTFEHECTVINTDDYMTHKKSNDLWISFNNDLDTFSIEDLTSQRP